MLTCVKAVTASFASPPFLSRQDSVSGTSFAVIWDDPCSGIVRRLWHLLLEARLVLCTFASTLPTLSASNGTSPSTMRDVDSLQTHKFLSLFAPFCLLQLLLLVSSSFSELVSEWIRPLWHIEGHPLSAVWSLCEFNRIWNSASIFFSLSKTVGSPPDVCVESPPAFWARSGCDVIRGIAGDAGLSSSLLTCRAVSSHSSSSGWVSKMPWSSEQHRCWVSSFFPCFLDMEVHSGTESDLDVLAFGDSSMYVPTWPCGGRRCRISNLVYRVQSSERAVLPSTFEIIVKSAPFQVFQNCVCRIASTHSKWSRERQFTGHVVFDRKVQGCDGKCICLKCHRNRPFRVFTLAHRFSLATPRAPSEKKQSRCLRFGSATKWWRAEWAQQLKTVVMSLDERKTFATTKEDLEQNSADISVVMQRQVLVIQKAKRTVDIPLLQYIVTTVDVAGAKDAEKDSTRTAQRSTTKSR